MRLTRLLHRRLAGALFAAALPAVAHAGAPCEPIGAFDTVVSLQPPAGAQVVGLKLRLQYPSAGLDLPGDADEATVKERVRPLPGGLLYSPNDSDGTLIVALVGTTPIAAGPLLEVRFDRCKGAPNPNGADLKCTVEQASDDKGGLIEKGVTCAVAPQARKENGK
jgi:hypothetical protein